MQNTRLAALDHDLGPEIDMLRNSVRDFADEKIAPIAAEIDKTDRFPIPRCTSRSGNGNWRSGFYAGSTW